jgi:Cu+-exporting ATPase
MAQATARLKTTGMHCASCSMLVDMTLGDLAGVESSKTDHASGDTVVDYDSDVVSVDAMIDAIREVGYDAEPSA